MDMGVLSAGHKETDNEAIAIKENENALAHIDRTVKMIVLILS